jgi:hypothetical protein
VIISRKAALSLLISLVLFAVFTVLAFTGLFDLVETRFYNPSIIKSLEQELSRDTELIDEYITELQRRFAATLREGAVQRSFLPSQDNEDIFERARLYGTLLESLGGLQSVRFIDAGGTRVHYSTSPEDVLRQDRNSIAYRDYQDSEDVLPYSRIAAGDGDAPRLILDETGDRLLFSLPFSDSFSAYRGTALFSLSARAVTEQLITAGRIKAGENVSAVSDPPGLVSGLPHSGGNVLIPIIASVWRDGILSLSSISSAEPPISLNLISAKTSRGIFVGRLVDEALFVFPSGMKIILLVSFILTVYIVVFLLMNIRQDPMAVIQSRLKRLQVNLIEEYYEHKNDADWTHWQRELEQRREEVRSELKRGLGDKTEKNGQIDSFIDNAWDELLAVIGRHGSSQGISQVTANIDEEKLQSILNRVLSAIPQGTIPSPESQTHPEETLDELEELEELIEEMDDGEIPAEETERIEETEASPEAVSAAPVPGFPSEEELEDFEGLLEGLDDAEEPAEQLTADEPTELAAPISEISDLEELLPEPSAGADIDITEGFEAVDDADLLPSPDMSIQDALIHEMASNIEFSPQPEVEAPNEDIDGELEIISPLETLFSDLSGEDEAGSGKSGGDEESDAVLEELSGGFMASVMYKPFQFRFNRDGNFELLKVQEDDAESELVPVEGEKVIETRDGVNFINEKFLEPHEEPDLILDPEMKSLIDEVINKNLSD